MADDAADIVDEAAAAASTTAAALPRSKPSIKEAKIGKGGDNDAPTTLLLARFIQKFCLQINGPVVVAVVVVRRRGGHELARPPGGCQRWQRMAWGSGIVIGKTKIGRSESSNNWQ